MVVAPESTIVVCVRCLSNFDFRAFVSAKLMQVVGRSEKCLSICWDVSANCSKISAVVSAEFWKPIISNNRRYTGVKWSFSILGLRFLILNRGCAEEKFILKKGRVFVCQSVFCGGFCVPLCAAERAKLRAKLRAGYVPVQGWTFEGSEVPRFESWRAMDRGEKERKRRKIKVKKVVRKMLHRHGTFQRKLLLGAANKSFNSRHFVCRGGGVSFAGRASHLSWREE